MPYTVSKARNKRKSRRVINIHQNKFSKGYVSTIDNSRRPQDSLSDMTNMELVQDNVARPRPPLARYGTQPTDTVLGRGSIRYDGLRSLIWMQRTAYDEVQTIATTGSPTGGTFRLGFEGDTAGVDMPYNVSASSMQAVLINNITSLQSGDIVCSGGPLPTPITITFGGSFAGTNTSLFTLDLNSLTGGTSPSVSITETVRGGYRGALYKQSDGGAYTLIDDGGLYNDEAWASCVQSKGNAYIFNGVDNLSYVQLSDNTIHTYTALDTPVISSVTKTGMTGTTYTHYYRVTANNEVGESIASTVASDTSGKVRDAWIENTDYIDVTWGAVAGATSYTVYYGTSSDTTNELYTVSGATTFRDLGTLATNPFKLAPEGNSTEGAVFTWMYVDTKNSQIFGITTDNKLYYSAAGTGDFSPFNGGGWVAINENGDTQLNFVDGFRNGKGDPIITVSARGAAGKGKLYHVSFDQLTVGDQVIIYPNVVEANGQSGTYAPRATVKARDSLWYPTGQDFKSTGTSQNIMNILTTNSISQLIEPDVDRINLQALDMAVGVEYKDRLYFALPVGSTSNNEIWYLDLSRKNAWVLRWTVAAKDMWLYEDSDGLTHFCVLVDNKVLEFTRAGARPHQDDGEAFSSRLAFESLVWDEDGISLGKIRRQYVKLLFPNGTINVSSTGLTRRGTEVTAGSDTFIRTTTPTGIGIWTFSEVAGDGFIGGHQYGEDPGAISSYGNSVTVLELKPKGLLAELSWEVRCNSVGADYILSAVNTKGMALDDLVLKTG